MKSLSPKARNVGHRALLAITVAAMVGGMGACGDDPFLIRWKEDPDTVLLYSLARPEFNLLSGFNFQNRLGVTVEDATATGSWDLAVDTRDGVIVFLPPAALGVSSRAAIASLPGESFDLKEAPRDTAAYVSDRAVPVTMGTLYVVRTRQSVGSFGTRCQYYYKVQPLIIDPVAGTLTFMYDGSPVCNDYKLVPPD